MICKSKMPNDTPEISVIVPVYKVEKYIKECIDSILSQTFSDFELILVDDGSPDKCGEICDGYAEKDRRISVIHKQNGGLSDARNAGTQKANGKYIFFCDSDDLIHPKTLEILLGTAKSTGVKIVCCECVKGESPTEEFFRDTEVSPCVINTDEEGLSALFSDQKHRNYWTVIPKLADTQIVKKHLFPVGRLYEDNATAFLWLHEAEKEAVIGNRLYFYRTNPDSIMHRKFDEKRLDFLWAVERQIDFYKALGYKKMYGECFIYYLENCKYLYDCAKDFPDIQKKIRSEYERVTKLHAGAAEVPQNLSDSLMKRFYPYRYKIKKFIGR